MAFELGFHTQKCKCPWVHIHVHTQTQYSHLLYVSTALINLYLDCVAVSIVCLGFDFDGLLGTVVSKSGRSLPIFTLGISTPTLLVIQAVYKSAQHLPFCSQKWPGYNQNTGLLHFRLGLALYIQNEGVRIQAFATEGWNPNMYYLLLFGSGKSMKPVSALGPVTNRGDSSFRSSCGWYKHQMRQTQVDSEVFFKRERERERKKKQSFTEACFIQNIN